MKNIDIQIEKIADHKWRFKAHKHGSFWNFISILYRTKKQAQEYADLYIKTGKHQWYSSETI